VAYAHLAAQALHMVLAKYVAHQALTFTLAEAAPTTGDDARCVLAAMLQDGQGIIDFRRDIRFCDYSY
jgi:hypothetical protein